MPTAALGGAAPAGVLNQNLTHQLRRNGEEVFTVFELSRLLVTEAEIRLVDQGSAL
jgi:hypothetical protein